MAVRIRLTRMGKKKQPSYRLVVMDSRKPRDGEYIEQIGFYDPRHEPSVVEIDNDKALDWLRKGAQPSDRARKLLEISGAWTRFRIDRGDIHTVPDRPAEPPAAAGEAGEPTPTEDRDAPTPEAAGDTEAAVGSDVEAAADGTSVGDTATVSESGASTSEDDTTSEEQA